MVLKKVISMFISMLVLCLALSLPSYAEDLNTFEENEIVSEYAIGRDPVSLLAIKNGVASCVSATDGLNCIQISVTQTLQKYSGWFWSWDDVPNANWSATVNMNSISLTNSKSGLSSGTYRLMSVFTLTNSSGQTETITIYSGEKSV